MKYKKVWNWGYFIEKIPSIFTVLLTFFVPKSLSKVGHFMLAVRSTFIKSVPVLVLPDQGRQPAGPQQSNLQFLVPRWNRKWLGQSERNVSTTNARDVASCLTLLKVLSSSSRQVVQNLFWDHTKSFYGRVNVVNIFIQIYSLCSKIICSILWEFHVQIMFQQLMFF